MTEQEQETAIKTEAFTVRVTREVHRQLLTLQYQRKMAGEFVSFSEIIGQLLNQAGAA